MYVRRIGIALLLSGIAIFACGDEDAAPATGDAPDGGPLTSSSSSSSGGTDGAATTPNDPYAGPARSCAQPNGGQTCGPKGTDDCCTTLKVPQPGHEFNLDAFSITAGRFRVFITAVNGDVRGYIHTHRPDWFEAIWETQLPSKMDSGEAHKDPNSNLWNEGAGIDGVYQQLGPIHYGAKEKGGNEGCFTSEVGNARTYRLPDDVNKNLFGDLQQYDQDVLDKKPMQCATFFMFAAFCAWDGGRLPTLDELQYAWDGGDLVGHKYPWGATPEPSGWDDAYKKDPTGNPGAKPFPALDGDQTVANYEYNFWEPAKVQCTPTGPGPGDTGCDYSVYLAPPGRFPKGNGPFGHSDLAGDVYNIAGPMSGTPETDPTKRTAGLARSGAFDIHRIPNVHPAPHFGDWQPTNKYLAVGGRCARTL